MANFVEELKPSFLRFPGGNNLYGHPMHTKLEQMPTNLRPLFFFFFEVKERVQGIGGSGMKP